MKISQRLQQINRMVGPGYDHIWDCCCDHGLLGMLLLQRNAAPKVHFVDCVAPLMQQLSHELARFFPQQPISNPQNATEQTTTEQTANLQSEWQVHCLDVAALPLAQYGKQAKHLVIIAGVGGELLVELVRSIVANQQSQSDAHSGNDLSNHDFTQGACQLEFILCPVHHNYHVRSALAELGLSLKDEYLLEENQRFYEILHLTQANASSKTTETVPLSATGSIMWQGLDANKTRQAKRYLDQTIGHYQRIPEHRMPNKPQIVAAYQHILQQLNC